MFNQYFLLPTKQQTQWVKSQDQVVREAKDLNLIKLLVSNMAEFYDRKSSELRFLAPLFLALKALITASPNLKQ